MSKCGFSKLTPEELSELGRKGGKASGVAKRKKKEMRETLEVLLDLNLKNGRHVDVENVKSLAQLKGKNISVQEAIAIAMLQNAMRGDVRSAEWVRDTSGQKPTDKIEQTTTDIIIDLGNTDDSD